MLPDLTEEGYVDAPFRRQGVARALIAHVEAARVLRARAGW